MKFLIYSGVMEADLKSLEEKISKLVSLCGNLREENGQLRDDLSVAQQKAEALKNNMLLASNKLEVLLNNVPNDVEA
jgi:cell division protein ZapB